MEKQVASPESKLEFLRRQDAYAHETQDVQLKETHLAWVFLAGDHVYKLKKPISTPYLDFRTLDSRRHYCEQEVELNRRLAPDVYLGTIPLVRTAEGTFALGGQGEVVDWLVHMRRLPADRTLEYLTDNRSVPKDAPRGIAARLAEFYGDAPPAKPESGTYVDVMRRVIDENRRELTASSFGEAAETLSRVFEEQAAFLEEESALIRARSEAGRVVDAHGDLRPQHIYLLATPVIVDCLEFNRDLRVMDSASELAFLSLECERHGAPEVGQAIFDKCVETLQDDPPPVLVRFYRTYHACTRAKLAVWRFEEVHDGQDKYREKGEAYLRLAQASSGYLRSA